jgi:hypothetical protein
VRPDYSFGGVSASDPADTVPGMTTNNVTDRLPQLDSRPAGLAAEATGLTDRRWFLLGVFGVLGAVCVGFWAAAAAFLLSTL